MLGRIQQLQSELRMALKTPRDRSWLNPGDWADWVFNDRRLQWSVPLVALAFMTFSIAFASWWLYDSVKRVRIEYEISGSVDESVGKVSTQFWRLGKWALAACATLTAVVFWLSSRFVEPLKALTEVANEIECWAERNPRVDGRCDGAAALVAKVPKDGPAELMTLAHGFRRFLPKLEQMLDRLRNANAELESRVGRRTQELELRNVELDFNRRRLETALADAQAAASAKGRLMSVMSHELRQPLNTVIGYAEAMREEAAERMEPALAASIDRDLGMILQAARHLLGVINEVLDHAKLEANAVELHPKPLMVEPFCQSLRDLAKPLAEANCNSLNVEVADTAPSALVADEQKLKQVLLNLISNACKFTVGGKVTVKVDAAEREHVPGVRFVISDTGRGIPRDKIGQLFQKFYQVDDSIRRERGGTGLGLFICKELCDLMGGTIKVKSKLGVGSDFSLWVPLQSGSAAAKSDALVLLVDDDPIARVAAASELTAAGYRVAEASNVKDALSQARTQRPDVVAVNLGSASRSEAIPALRKDPATADVPLAMALPGAAAPADWFVKPIDWRVVGRRLDDFRTSDKRSLLLVIDDDPAHRELARRNLASKWEIIEASDGVAGLRKVAKRRPDAVLLDLYMPGLDGFGFMQRLHRLGLQPPVPVLVATAKDSYARTAVMSGEDTETWPRRIAEALSRVARG
jgi:signal transduction histidine kinase/DNA-binding response OmpR family regulator